MLRILLFLATTTSTASKQEFTRRTDNYHLRGEEKFEPPVALRTTAKYFHWRMGALRHLESLNRLKIHRMDRTELRVAEQRLIRQLRNQ